MSSSAPIGLIPAAGHARRLGSIPVSKEVFPVGVGADQNGEGQLRVAVDSLLHSFRDAGAEVAYTVLREGKWDVPAYLGGGAAYDLSLAYLVTSPTPGVPFTIDEATPFLRDARVLFGFPDVVFEPRDAHTQLLERLEDTGAALVLGLFPAREPSKADMVDVDAEGRVCSVVVKPTQTQLTYTWMIAAWTPSFTRFLHKEIRHRERPLADAPELHLGHVINDAVEAGLPVASVALDDAV